jgi:hypothetical protein
LFHNLPQKLNSKSARGDFNDFGKFSIVKLMHIIAHPSPRSKDICVFSTIIRKKIFTEVSSKKRRAIFATR